MNKKNITTWGSMILLCFSIQATNAGGNASIDGKWFRYPSPGSGNGKELAVPAPDPVPEPPLKPQYLQSWRDERAASRQATAEGAPLASGYTECLPDGMPAMMQGMFPMEVLESDGQVTIIQEAFQQIRRIYLDEELIPWEDAEPRFWGHSVAHWEDDVLVVETIGIKEYVKYRGVPHSAAMRIHEHIYLEKENYLVDEVTVVDPEYLTKPWSWTWKFERHPGYKMYEYVCENNREFADPETGEQRLKLFGE